MGLIKGKIRIFHAFVLASQSIPILNHVLDIFDHILPSLYFRKREWSITSGRKTHPSRSSKPLKMSEQEECFGCKWSHCDPICQQEGQLITARPVCPRHPGICSILPKNAGPRGPGRVKVSDMWTARTLLSEEPAHTFLHWWMGKYAFIQAESPRVKWNPKPWAFCIPKQSLPSEGGKRTGSTRPRRAPELNRPQSCSSQAPLTGMTFAFWVTISERFHTVVQWFKCTKKMYLCHRVWQFVTAPSLFVNKSLPTARSKYSSGTGMLTTVCNKNRKTFQKKPPEWCTLTYCCNQCLAHKYVISVYFVSEYNEKERERKCNDCH